MKRHPKEQGLARAKRVAAEAKLLDLSKQCSRKLAEVQVNKIVRVRNVLHGGNVAENFAEAVLTSNQIRRNKNHNSCVFL